jgi:hypothetical protein
MLKKMFVLIVLFASVTFSGFLFAENDEEVVIEGDAIDLLQVRDVILNSYSPKSGKSVSLAASVDAELLGNKILISVENFGGILDVEINSLSGSGSVYESYYINGMKTSVVNVSSLSPGYYSIELNMEGTTYIGKFSIKK